MSILTDPDRPEESGPSAGSPDHDGPGGLGRYGRTGILALAIVAAAVVAWSVLGPSGSEPEPAPSSAARPSPTPEPEPRREEAPPETSTPAPETRAPRARPRPAPDASAPAEPAEPVQTGVLRVESDVQGASVFLDRQYVGTTPFSATDLAPGTHRVNVSAEGYEGFADTVTLSAEAPVEISVRFKEVKLSESVAVVHRHGMGSCTGTLVASLDGLAYKTARRDDAFQMALSELEAFEIDYLKKNLRIKRRAGKTYNFTDDQPNADALLVFHRAVEKARAQLTAEK